MLIKFSVKNYLSFKDVAVLDLTAEALKEKKGYTHIPYQYNPKLNLVKSAVIYGYNSYGKSNLFRAYSSYRKYLLTSFGLGNSGFEIDAEPFMLNTEMLDKPCFFESIFVIKNTKYRYGFEIRKQKIISEWLYYADSSVRENALFHRLEQDFVELNKTWSKSSENRIEQAKIFTKSNNLFLSVLLSQEGIPRIDDIASWFKGNVILTSDYSTIINSGAVQIYTDEKYRNVILKFLQNADLGFKNIFEKAANAVNNIGIHQDLANLIYGVKQTNFDLFTQHRVHNKNYELQNTVEFSLQKSESTGSIKYFIVACYLAYAIKNGQLVFIDELDASLHTQLLIFLIEIFNSPKNNIGGAQLIFVTHNTVMLNRKLRRDQIWFVDKNEYGESSLHKAHTSAEPMRIDRSIEQDYRDGEIKKGTSLNAITKNIPTLFDENNDITS